MKSKGIIFYSSIIFNLEKCLKSSIHDLYYPIPKIQQTKMLVTCQRFGDLFLFGLVWQYSSLLACQFLANSIWSTTDFPISCRGLVTKIAILQYAIEDILLKLKNLNTLWKTCIKTEKSQYAIEDMH